MAAFIRRLLVACVAFGLGALPLVGGVSSAATMSWLDAPLSNWNVPGAPVPAAPASDWASNLPNCTMTSRPAETAEDNALVAAGWTLFGNYQSGWGTRIVGAEAGVDGMCRPMDYQYFVFVKGKFAGTISPATMGSRLDGSSDMPRMDGGGQSLSANFARYANSDPLCCPSATSNVTYSITMTGGLPLLVPTNVSTTQNAS